MLTCLLINYYITVSRLWCENKFSTIHVPVKIFPWHLFQLITFREWKPAIHLDNRYRLMRHEPMLDADGNKTDKIGKIGNDYY